MDDDDDLIGVAVDPVQEEVEDVLIREFFDAEPQSVFYTRQLEVQLERKYFHWITGRALRHLARQGGIQTETQELWPRVNIKFYFSTKCRYWRRRASAILSVVRRFSTESFGHALGRQGETMFDAALGSIGFRTLAKNVNEFDGLVWRGSGEDLDRIYVSDGLRYGCEIKNTLDYIPREELESKLEACQELEVTPLFIMRKAPQTYMHQIIQAGGYGLIFDMQLYPFGQEAFVEEVRHVLGLPVGSPAAVPEGILQKFETWHDRRTAR